jgi:hypothetical protein
MCRLAQFILSLMECQVLEAPGQLADSIASFERRLLAQEPISLDEVKALEQQAQPYKHGPHYQLAQRVRKLSLRLGHVDEAQWEQVKQAPAPVFNVPERSYIGRLASTNGAPVELKVVYDHLFLTTNYRAAIGTYDLVKITHRFNREGRLDLIDARLKQTKLLYQGAEAALPKDRDIFHLVQTFAFKEKQIEPGWTESRCEYYIRIRQIAPVFYDLGLSQEEQQYRYLLQRGHQLMKELHQDLRSGSLRDIRVVRPPFYPFRQLQDDEGADYVISRAASVEPRVLFDRQRNGGHLGDLRIKYTSA